MERRSGNEIYLGNPHRRNVAGLARRQWNGAQPASVFAQVLRQVVKADASTTEAS